MTATKRNGRGDTTQGGGTMPIYDYKFIYAVMCNSQSMKYSNSFPGYSPDH